jgi:hypothetical protein
LDSPTHFDGAIRSAWLNERISDQTIGTTFSPTMISAAGAMNQSAVGCSPNSRCHHVRGGGAGPAPTVAGLRDRA